MEDIFEKLESKLEMEIIQKPQGKEYRLFVAFSDEGKCLYVATTERGYMQLQWLDKLGEMNVHLRSYIFEDKKECMEAANRILVTHGSEFNKKLNSSAISILGLSNQVGISRGKLKKMLKESGVNIIKFENQFYVDLDQTEFVREVAEELTQDNEKAFEQISFQDCEVKK